MFNNDSAIPTPNQGLMDFSVDPIAGPSSSSLFPSTPTEPFSQNNVPLAISESITSSSPNFMEMKTPYEDEIMELFKDNKSNAPTSDTDINTDLGKGISDSFGMLNYNTKHCFTLMMTNLVN